jgi:signal transduction histidine kinase
VSDLLESFPELVPEDEDRRMAAVRRYDILDTPPDGAFDRITQIAAKLFDVPISIISLVDHDRIWFKSHHGLDVEEIDRAPGLCASAILHDGPWILNDAKYDARSLSNPLVAGEFGLRFYAGVPLRTSDGHNLGTLCVIDHEPRDLTADQVARLGDLAAVVVDQMELRLAARQAVAELRDSHDRLATERHTLEVLNRTGSQAAAELDLQKLVQLVVDAGVDLTGAQFGAFFYNVQRADGERFMLYRLAGAEMSDFEHFGMPRPTRVFAPTFRGEGVIRSPDITKDPRYGKNSPHAGMPEGHLPVKSYLSVPVASRSGQVIGGLIFGHGEPAVFDERSERVMVGLAAQAAIAIENARLFQSVQGANEMLEQRVAERTAELEHAHEALRQAQKMEAIGQLTGGIAHDFNNILTGIIGSLHLMQRRIDQGRMSEVERFATAAVTSANRAAALTHRLLAFSRRQPLDPRPVDANRFVASLEELLRRTIGESVDMEIVTAAGLWMTLCDPHQLESAVLNLAINARDAMPEGGKLTIETCNAHIDESYAARKNDVVPGQYICICVTDTGTGMTADVVDKAFEPFFTTKPIGQGTGLGLSMIYGFARQSEGSARIYSEPGQGTTVKLYLPRYFGEAQEPEDAAPALNDEHLSEHGEVVLVVEDEPAVRDLVIEVLRDLGYRAIEAADGPSGLRILQSKQRIDVLITDIGLPGLNGRQIADAARLVRPKLKILFMTGYAENATIANGILEPGMQMITKPFAVEALAMRIRDMIQSA